MFKQVNVLDRYKKMSKPVKASFWFLVCSFLQKGISIITTPIFTRLLSTQEYGQFNVFNSWMSILAVVVTLNLSQAIYTQGLIKFSEERNVYTSSLQGLTVTLVAAWSAIYFLFYNFWNGLFSLTTVQMVAMLVMMWTTAVFNFWAAEQRVLLNYKSLVILTLIVSVLKPTLGIILVSISSDKVTARIIGLLIVEIVGYSWLFVIHMRQGKVFCSGKFWKYALRLNLPLVPHYLSQIALNSVDRIMIERMIGASEAGIYSLAYSLSLIMTVFNTALMATLNPWIYQKIKDRKEKEIGNVAYIALGFVAAVNLLLILFAPEVVRIFAPSTYYEAIYVIPPVAMSVFFLFAYDFFAKFEFYYEKTQWVAIATVSSALLNIVTNYIFIRMFGYFAAGYTTLTCYILYSLFHYVMMKRICKKNMDGSKVFDGRILFIISLIFVATGFIFMGLYKLPLARYMLIAIVLVLLIIFRKKLYGVLSIVLKRDKKPAIDLENDMNQE